jgi:hypothetical protein
MPVNAIWCKLYKSEQIEVISGAAAALKVN